MRRLLLLRHAKSSWDDPNLSDHARPLNARGRQAADSVRATLHEAGLRPDLVLVSSARRTLQTLEALGSWAPAPAVEPMDALYLAGPEAILDVLRQVEDRAGCVLLIGHNPGLHEAATRLAGPGSDAPAQRRLADGFPTATLAEFEVGSAWSALGWHGARLARFTQPVRA